MRNHTVALSKEKQGEIALAILKLKFREDRKIPDANEMKRNIGNVSKKTGFSQEDLKDFMILLVKENTENFIFELRKPEKERPKI